MMEGFIPKFLQPNMADHVDMEKLMAEKHHIDMLLHRKRRIIIKHEPWDPQHPDLKFPVITYEDVIPPKVSNINSPTTDEKPKKKTKKDKIHNDGRKCKRQKSKILEEARLTNEASRVEESLEAETSANKMCKISITYGSSWNRQRLDIDIMNKYLLPLTGSKIKSRKTKKEAKKKRKIHSTHQRHKKPKKSSKVRFADEVNE